MAEQMGFDFGDGFAPKTQAMSSAKKGVDIKLRSADVENPAWWHPLEIFEKSFGSKMGLNEALRQTAVLICVDVLASDIAKAKLQLKRKVKGGGCVVVEPTEHPLAMMLALEPNIRHTWEEFIAMMVYHFALTSNAYAYVRRNNLGDVLELIPVMTGRVQDKVVPGQRETFYEITAATQQEVALLGRSSITAPERDVVHIRNRMMDGFFGYSTLFAGADVLKRGKALADYEETMFGKDAMLRGFFSRPKIQGESKETFNDAAFRRIQEQLKKIIQRSLSDNEPILLEDGIQYHPLSMKAAEAEFSKALSNHIEAICQLFKMPPHKAMHLASVKYENLATMEQQYAKSTLHPICVAFEARFARTLLTPKERLEYFFEFDRDELSMADERVEIEWVKAMLDRSAIDIDEAREMAGWNPMSKGRGKARLIPANGVLIDENNEVVASGAAAQGGAETNSTEEQQANQNQETKSAGLRLVKA